MNNSLDIGRVISLTFQALRQNPFEILRVALLCYFLPSIVVLGMEQINSSFILVSGLFEVVLAGLLTALLVKPVMVALGASDTFIGGLSNFPRYAVTVVIFYILSILGYVLGFFALVVPGLYLMTIWSIGIPAIVAEDIGMSEAFKRSADLTLGHRWQVLSLLIIFILMSFLLLLPSISLIFLIGEDTALYRIVEIGLMTFGNVIISVSLIVIYLEILWIKDGVGPESIASVFD